MYISHLLFALLWNYKKKYGWSTSKLKILPNLCLTQRQLFVFIIIGITPSFTAKGFSRSSGAKE